MKRDDGGAAFPREDYQADNAPGQSGMSLRDYFAANALNGVVAIECSKAWDGGPTISDEQIALRCYTVADAMIAERRINKGGAR